MPRNCPLFSSSVSQNVMFGRGLALAVCVCVCVFVFVTMKRKFLSNGMHDPQHMQNWHARCKEKSTTERGPSHPSLPSWEKNKEALGIPQSSCFGTCVRVCVYVWVQVCMHARACVCVCVCINVCDCVSLCVTMKKKMPDEWQTQHVTQAILVSSSKHTAKKNTSTARGALHRLITAIIAEEKGKGWRAQWPIGYDVGLRIKRSSVRIRPWPLRWVFGQGSLLPLSQGEAFTLASISYLAILVKYILAKGIYWSYVCQSRPIAGPKSRQE